MFVVVGSVHVKPEARTRFLEIASDNATGSVRDEPGCLRFDVLEDREQEDHFIFVEAYLDEAAFDAHFATPHYARWSAERDAVLAGKPVRTLCEPRVMG